MITGKTGQNVLIENIFVLRCYHTLFVKTTHSTKNLFQTFWRTPWGKQCL